MKKTLKLFKESIKLPLAQSQKDIREEFFQKKILNEGDLVELGGTAYTVKVRGSNHVIILDESTGKTLRKWPHEVRILEIKDLSVADIERHHSAQVRHEASAKHALKNKLNFAAAFHTKKAAFHATIGGKAKAITEIVQYSADYFGTGKYNKGNGKQREQPAHRIVGTDGRTDMAEHPPISDTRGIKPPVPGDKTVKAPMATSITNPDQRRNFKAFVKTLNKIKNPTGSGVKSDVKIANVGESYVAASFHQDEAQKSRENHDQTGYMNHMLAHHNELAEWHKSKGRRGIAAVHLRKARQLRAAIGE